MDRTTEECSVPQFRDFIDLHMKDQLPSEVKEDIAKMFASLYKEVNSSFIGGLQQLLINMSTLIPACKNSVRCNCFSEVSKPGDTTVEECPDKGPVFAVPAIGINGSPSPRLVYDEQNGGPTMANDNDSSIRNGIESPMVMGTGAGDGSKSVLRHVHVVCEESTHSLPQLKAIASHESSASKHAATPVDTSVQVQKIVTTPQGMHLQKKTKLNDIPGPSHTPFMTSYHDGVRMFKHNANPPLMLAKNNRGGMVDLTSDEDVQIIRTSPKCMGQGADIKLHFWVDFYIHIWSEIYYNDNL